MLTSPLIARLRAAYPEATIDVLASPSNHEVFEADPRRRPGPDRRADLVRAAARAAGDCSAAVWELGRSLRGEGYDLGIDVRGDVLTVLVLALAGIPRRVGWAMGGGAFLLTDVADWVRGRHEVRSRLALLEPLGIAPDEPARVDGPRRRPTTGSPSARWLAEAWPAQACAARLEASGRRRRPRRGHADGHGDASRARGPRRRTAGTSPTGCTPAGSAPLPPLLAVHLGAGTAAKRWPRRHWNSLIQRFLAGRLAGRRRGRARKTRRRPRSSPPHDRLRDWTGRLTVTQTTALLERADLFIGADSGPAHLAASAGTLSVILFSGTNQPGQWRPWSRHSLILRHRVPCQPCHQKLCPLADHPCMSGLRPRPRLPRRPCAGGRASTTPSRRMPPM